MILRLVFVWVMLFCLSGCAQVDQVEYRQSAYPAGVSMLLMSAGGSGVPDTHRIRPGAFESGHAYSCESAEWGISRGVFRSKATFCRTDAPHGWHEDDLRSESFLRRIKEPGRSYAKGSVNAGRAIRSAVGHTRLFGFDFNAEYYRLLPNECMGMTVKWNRGEGSYKNNYAKYLDFYSCAPGGTSKAALLTVLSGFSIKGEFDAMVEVDF